MKPRLFLAAVALTASTDPALADRGSIPFELDATIYEPSQRAMIAWDGKEEILLLTTDLRASKPTRVLEVMPFPSEPVATKGDLEAFRRAAGLLQRAQATAKRDLGLDELTVMTTAPAGEVTFHETIGAHDVSVTHVLSAGGFLEWVERYLRGAGVENPRIPEPTQAIIREYLDEGFTWFAFDVVSLDGSLQTNDALQYRFRSDRLFYPIKISRTDVGETSIELVILTPRLLGRFPGIPREQVELEREPVRLSQADLRFLHEEMAELLGRRDGMMLRTWRIRGDLAALDRDLIAW